MDYDLNASDLILVGDAEIEQKGLVDHHITSANEYYEMGVPQIITQVFKIDNMRLDDVRRETEDEKAIEYVTIQVTFSDVNIGRPSLLNYNSGKEEIIFPNTARIKEKTYKGALRIGVHIIATAHLKNGTTIVREDKVTNFKICKMPIMVGSRWCNTHGMSEEALTRLNEDPSDPGGYFIIKGVEWVVDCVENILFNKVRIFKNEGYKKEMMRAEFISKPGDFYLNSDQFIARWLIDGQLTIEIKREKLKDLQIPFYLIFRMMGWNTDKQIYDNLLYDYNTPTSEKLNGFLTTAFNVKYAHLSKGRYKYSQNEVVQYIAEEIAEKEFAYLDVSNNPENYQKITNLILDYLDVHFLQHLGSTMHSRDKKLRFLCVVLRKIFLVKLKNMEPTDRDSYNSKRIAAAGVSCAKTFKTHFNATIIQQIRKKLAKDMKTMSFFKIELGATVRASVYGIEFERALIQSITAGNKSEITVSKKTRINRLSSQLLNRKNQLNTYSTLRQVTATSSESGKQSERANEMRRVHLSFLGYICIIHTPEGEKVGINKQLALFSFVTKASSSAVIKDILLDDKEIYNLDAIDYKDIAEKRLCNVYVNGDWIGCCNDAIYIAQKYRQMRREFKINPEITIVWDNTQDEVYFWTDAGRVIRPLMIVYNNERDPVMFKKITANKKYGSFYQGIALTQKHIDGLYAKTISNEDLLRDNVIEYISAEEQENMYLAPSYEHLGRDRNNELHEYTHCDIPQAMFGLTGLTCPFPAHNYALRVQFQTSQSRQTCGCPAKNWTHRVDKDTFLQYNSETPIVKTLSNKYLYPNGSNCMVAMMCNTGFNQEDSLIINKGAIDRGLYNGCKFTFYKTELEPNREEFANPDITTTIDIKSACYDKLKNGIISKGAVIHKNDAIIGKVMKLTKTSDDSNDTYKYADRSIIYKDEEPAVVHNVIVDRNEDDEQFCKVILRKLRPVTIGDKFCFTENHEVLTSSGWKNIADVSLADRVATLRPTTHEIIWQNPTEVVKFEHNGSVYHVRNENIDMKTTLNHKMYVRETSKYELIEAQNIIGKKVYYKKNGKNGAPDLETFELPEYTCQSNGLWQTHPARDLNMNAWLTFFGIYLSKGHIDKFENVYVMAHKKRIKNELAKSLQLLGFCYDASKNCFHIKNRQLYEYLIQFGKSRDKFLPAWAFGLSSFQSKLLLDSMLGDGYYNVKKNSYEYCTESRALVDGVQILAINSGRVANFSVKKSADEERVKGAAAADRYNIYISEYRLNLEPVSDSKKTVETIEEYKGYVYCLTVPEHIFMVRHNGKYCWSGNSSRAGQKGTCGVLLDEADMPRTREGIAPAIIMNPHCIPSRMTTGQLIEALVACLGAERCAQIDATFFKKVDIDSIALLLDQLGLNKYGNKRLYNGITGEYIDCMIFMNPTYMQRLQKFCIDSLYGVSSGPSDAITRQPLDGKGSNGGLRIGEMERDVIVSHSAMKFMTEKFFSHSDGFTHHVCRCGKAATVNIAKGIYKCNYCKDNADIVAYNTSWSSKLFIQELESMNVGIRQKPDPFTYDTVDSEVDKILT